MYKPIARSLALSGLLIFGGAAAFAQSELRIDVPFTFHTPNATMAPGRYSIVAINGAQPVAVYRFRNLASGKAVAVTAANKRYRSRSDKTGADVEFRCAGEYCALAAIHGLNSPTADLVPVRLKPAAAPNTPFAQIRIPASE
jgi:hypothetical protein